MSKGIITAAGALALVGVVGVGLPYYAGAQFEQRFRASVAELPKSFPYPIEITRYERGVFSSSAETRITIPRNAIVPEAPTEGDEASVPKPSALAPIVAVLHHDIQHGPRLDGFRAIRMRTVPVLPEDIQKALAEYIHDQPVVESIDDISFAGALIGRVISPAITAVIPGKDGGEPGKLVWAGMTGSYTLTSNAGHLKLDVTAPKLSVASANGSFGLDTINLSANLTRGSVGGLWLGDGGMTIADVRVTAGPESFGAERIAVKSTTTEQDGAMKSTADFSAKNLDGGGQSYENPLLRMSFTNLDSAALYEGVQRIQAISAKGGDPAAQLPEMMAAMQHTAGRMAVRKPIFAIDELSVQNNGGAMHITGQIQYIGDGNIETFSPVTDLAGALSFEMPAAMFDRLMASKLEADLRKQGTNATQAAEVARQNAGSTRGTLMANKLLISDGDQLHSKVDYQGGQLIVNGAPFQGFGPPQPSRR